MVIIEFLLFVLTATLGGMFLCGASDGAEWKGRRSTDKSYSRDNRLIFPKSSHRREGLEALTIYGLVIALALLFANPFV